MVRPTLCLVRPTGSQTPGGSWKDPVNQGLSFLPLCHLSECFLGIGLLDLSNFWYGSRSLYEVVHGRVGVFGKKTFFAPKIGEMGQK